MRLVTIDSREVGGRPGIGLPSGEILDLAASPAGLTAAQWRPQSVVSVLAEGAEGAARVALLIGECAAASDTQRQQWRSTGRLLPAAGTRLMAPIRRPGLLLMVTDSAAGPSACYVKNPNSATGPDAVLAMPEGEHPHLYLLGMLGMVIGRPLFRVTAGQAVRGIAALTLVADLGTERLGSGPNGGRTDARQFPGACVVGPALVTIDEFSPGANWALTVRVNGRAVSTGASALNLEQAATLVAGLSSRYAFRPGDIVGFPGGAPEIELPASSRVSLSLNAALELGFATGE